MYLRDLVCLMTKLTFSITGERGCLGYELQKISILIIRLISVMLFEASET